MIAPRTKSATPDPRLWPGIVLVAIQWIARFVVPAIEPEYAPYGVIGAVALGPLVLIWFVFFSRLPRLERWGGLGLVILAIVATPWILDASIATGAMGMLYPILAIPGLCLALLLWALLTRNVTGRARFVTLTLAIFVASGAWALVRTGGFSGDMKHEFAWRWSKSHEDLVVEAQEEPLGAAAIEALETLEPEGLGPAVWPGFRGPHRDGIARQDLRFATDWSASPPVEVWRRDVGPGWGSFAVRGDLVYTQEQRGEDEVVACYRLSDGEPVWRHGDPVRFWESNAGAGPRATPSIDGDMVFALGATGLVNALDALDGTQVWQRDASADTGTQAPMWGYSGSPLVMDDLVVIAASGRLIAYDRGNGETRWTAPEGSDSYVSPHLVTLDGVRQILHLNGEGLVGIDPTSGEVLFRHDWSGYPIVQPAVTDDGDVLIAVSDRSGLRRLSVSQREDGWQAEELWTSIRLKPYFDDFVIHEGHAYGFDGRILAAIDLETGERAWKGGRYGNGQLFLLPSQDVLVVLSEDGELALVRATPNGFEELALVPALEGRTWNHPVLAGDLVLVRNGKEMAAYRLPTT